MKWTLRLMIAVSLASLLMSSIVIYGVGSLGDLLQTRSDALTRIVQRIKPTECKTDPDFLRHCRNADDNVRALYQHWTMSQPVQLPEDTTNKRIAHDVAALGTWVVEIHKQISKLKSTVRASSLFLCQ